jgi:hypothetical protein
MESQRGDVTHVSFCGRVAWRAARHALLSAQDTEDGLSDCILGNCSGMARGLVEHVDRGNTIGLRDVLN